MIKNKIKKLPAGFVSTIIWIIGLGLFIPFGIIILIGTIRSLTPAFDKFIKAGARFLVRCMFVRVKVEGLENFNRNETYLFMANHVNLLDILILYGYVPNAFRGVELEKHFSWLLYGIILRQIGAIPISHSNPRQALQSLIQAKEVLKSGISIVILPEGGRTLDGNFKPFKNGPFLLAKKAQADIVPVVMIDAYQIMRKGSKQIHPGKMKLRFGKVIPYNAIKNLEVSEVNATVHQTMVELMK